MDLADKPVNQFLKECRDAGLDFTFEASSGSQKYVGECKKDEAGQLKLKIKKVA